MTENQSNTLTALAASIASGERKAVETVNGYLDRIASLNPQLNAYVEVQADRARARAEAVDRGEVTGPLAGVPIAIKDNLCMADDAHGDAGHTTCSSRMLDGYRSPFTATAVQRLEDAGAIVLGKTNLDEFAMGSSTEHAAGGVTKNPWDVSRVPGGSSGGSAAAVAADLCAGALGSDTGGSIRQPAAFCGVVGMKPTYGRVSRWGLVAFASSLDQIGPFGRSVEDTARLLQAMTGPAGQAAGDPRDSTCSEAPVDDYLGALHEPIAGLRVGVPRELLGSGDEGGNDPAVNAAVQRSIDALTQAGASIVDIQLPHSGYGVPTYYIVATAEASSNLARYDGVHYGHRTDYAARQDENATIELYKRSRAEGFGDEVKRRIMLGTYALSSGYYDAYYLRALKVRRLIQRDFLDAFEQCDVILTPTTPTPAFAIGEKSDDPLELYLSDIYTVNANLAGLPGISLPVAMSGAAREAGDAAKTGPDLPVGVQLLGPVLGESLLLRAARMLERGVDFGPRVAPAST